MRLERSCAHAGYSPHIIFEAASLRDLLQSIRENSAVAVVLECSAQMFNLSGIRMIPLDAGEYKDNVMGISWKSNPDRAQIAMDIRNYILAYLSEQQH